VLVVEGLDVVVR
jgi:hypothetical protein